MTKIAIKTQSATNLIAYGGAAVVDGLLRPFSIDSLIDQKLGLRGKTIAAFKYSEIFRSVLYTKLCGGEHLEDVSLNTVGSTLRAIMPDVPSPDTTSRGLRSLAVEDTMYVDERTGHEYLFSVNKQMNELMLEMQIRLGQLKEGEKIDVVDFDHVFLPNEKEYAKPSYKKKTGEFPGVAMTGGQILYIEDRDANTNVRFKQETTLNNMFTMLDSHNIGVKKFRADCGSYSEEIIKTVNRHCEKLYIRASNCADRETQFEAAEGWESVTINKQECDVLSMPFVSKTMDLGDVKNLRLIVQRTIYKDDKHMGDLFETTYIYRCILTNDNYMTAKEVIEFYNQRGESEKNFDIQNNDFCWSRLPFRKMKENNVFLIVMAMIKNIYLYLIARIANVMPHLDVRNRLRRFIFEFMTVPAKLTSHGGRNVLTLFTDRPYEKLVSV